MPKFGPRKIGQAAFARDKIKQTQKRKFGPRKFGAKKAAEMARELHAAETAADLEARGAPAQADGGEAPSTSVKQMAQALSENNALLDEFIGLEKARVGGTRKTAIKLFLGTEMAKAEDARDEVLDELQALLKKS